MEERAFSRPIRRLGHTVTIAVNLAVLWIANRLLEWDWFPWLTEEFADVLPWINVSILTTILTSALFLIFDDTEGLKPTIDVISSAVSLAATVKLLAVFPFDFEPYAFPWDFLVRVVLGLAILGMSVGLIVNVVMIARRFQR